MSRSNNERSYRKYYIDHPTSINHQQKYLVPLQNQYSILNQPRNPYAALDNFSFDLAYNHNNMNAKSASRLVPLQNQSLNMQVLEWERKNIQKENEYKMMKSQVRDLSRLVKLKEMEEQLAKISKRKEKPQDRSIIMPYPMMMPFMGGMGMGMGMGGHCCSCSCRCSCSNRCSCQGDHKHTREQQRMPQKYQPVMTQNYAIQTDPQPITNVTQPVQIKKVSIPRIPTQKSVAVIEPIKRQPPKKKKNLLRRLRVVCYAIYFCIYFKWFSFQFSINRYTRFRGKYLNNQSQTLTSQLKQIYDQLLGIDIITMVKDSVSKVSEPKVTHEDFQLKSLLKAQAVSKFNKIGNLSYLSNDYQTLYLRCGQFILSLLDQVQTLLIDWDWGQVAEGLGVGTINQTFVIDNAFLPHEIYLLIFHDGKGYARLGPEEEKMLMTIKILVKLLIYNVCLQLDNNKEWFEINEEVIENEDKMDQIFIFLEISTKILFIICQNLYEKAIVNKDTNYGQVDQKFKIEPSNPLIYSHSIKKRRQLFKNQDVKQSNLLIFGIEKLDEVNNIAVMSFFEKMEKKIINKISKSMSSVVAKVKQYNRQKYAQIWQETLSNQYLVLRGIKKIMKPNKFYPFASASVLASKKNVSSKTLQKRTIDQGSINSFNTKVSLQNMIQRASNK